MRPRRCMSLRSLYQLTHAEVNVLQVGEGTDRAGAKRGAWAYALGFVEPDRGFAQRVVQGVADGTDRRYQPFQHQRLAVMYCSVLTSGVAMMDRAVERMALTGAERRGVVQGDRKSVV